MELVEELRIGDSEEPGDFFGAIRGVLPGPDGGMWVLDAQVPQLRLFDQEGRLVREVGRSGQGPGEFPGNLLDTCAFAGPAGEVWVEDRVHWQRFSAEGELLGDLPPRGVSCSPKHWLPDNRLLVSEMSREDLMAGRGARYVMYQFTPEGQLLPIDTISQPTLREVPVIEYENPDGSPAGSRSMPFVAAGQYWVHPQGGYLLRSNDTDYAMEHVSFEGDTLGTTRHRHEPVVIPDSIRTARIDEIRNGRLAVRNLDDNSVPRTYSPFETIYSGSDGKFWVQRFVEGGASALDAFSGDGGFVGSLRLDEALAGLAVFHITEDHIFGKVQDELGVESAVKLAIRTP